MSPDLLCRVVFWELVRNFPKAKEAGYIWSSSLAAVTFASAPRKIFVAFEASLLEGVYSMGLVVCSLEVV